MSRKYIFIVFAIVANMVLTLPTYADSWVYLSSLDYTKDANGSSDSRSRVNTKVYASKIRVKKTSNSTYYNIVLYNAGSSIYPGLYVSVYTNYTLVKSADSKTVYSLQYKGTQVSSGVWEYDLNTLAQTTDNLFYVSNWQKNVDPATVQVYIKDSCTITWQNYDGSILQTEGVAYGSTPTYSYTHPARPDTEEYSYTFIGWEPEIVPAYSDATYTAIFDSLAIQKHPEGILPGRFTINENGDQVVFSQGNLQYKASDNTWRFAENQYDFIGDENSNISSSYDGWIDLFGWGTSGYDNTANDPFAVNYQPWATSKARVSQHVNGYSSDKVNTYGYGPSIFMDDKNLTGTSADYDWGVYNAIVNGSNQKGLWRTLSSSEWTYISSSRNFAQYLRSQATVCGVHGYVLLPDDFTLPEGLSWSYQANDWETNIYDVQTWSIMEDVGAVFLPAAGIRHEKDVNEVGTSGYYWSSTYSYQLLAMYVYFDSDEAFNRGNINRFGGQSVRLVQDKTVEKEIPTAISDTDAKSTSHKILRNGQLLILREGKVYNVQGLEVK